MIEFTISFYDCTSIEVTKSIDLYQLGWIYIQKPLLVAIRMNRKLISFILDFKPIHFDRILNCVLQHFKTTPKILQNNKNPFQRNHEFQPFPTAHQPPMTLSLIINTFQFVVVCKFSIFPYSFTFIQWCTTQQSDCGKPRNLCCRCLFLLSSSTSSIAFFLPFLP